GLFGMFILAAARRILGSLWLAAPASVAIFALLGDPTMTIDFGQPRLLALLFLQSLPMALVLLRFGLLAGIAAALAGHLPRTAVSAAHPSSASFPASVGEAGALAAVALVGWHATTRRGL